MLGIRNFFSLAAAQTVSASVTLVTLTGFSRALAAGQRIYGRLWLPFTVAATGGFRFQIVCPAAPAEFVATWTVQDVVTPAAITAYQTASAAFANALAVAGDHFANCDFYIENGVNAGNVEVQFACNSAANAISVNAGAAWDAVLL